MATKKVAKVTKFPSNADVMTATELFAAGTPVAVRTEIPEIGGAILVRAMSARDVLSFVGAKKSENPEEQQAAIIALIQKTVVNPDGSHMFPSEEDVDRLRNLRLPVFNAIASAVTDAAGLGTKKEVKADELGKD